MKTEFPTPFRLLHLEDSPPDRGLVEHELAKTGWQLEIAYADRLEGFVEMVQQHTFDVILADYSLAAR